MNKKLRKHLFNIRNFVPYFAETKFLHFSYHKCLTVLYGRVMRSTMSEVLPGGYHHFQSYMEDFRQYTPKYKGASVNNHAVDLKQLGFPFRASCFVRDPRDLVISGYFYHKRGAEEWCRIRNPTPSDWKTVNGSVPTGLENGQSLQNFLENTDLETGILAEFEFRRNHFDAMRHWDYAQPNLLRLRYEDAVGNELEAFGMVADFYEFPEKWKKIMLQHADKLSLKSAETDTSHIRDPKPSQWEEYFSDDLKKEFKKNYGDLLIRLGYETDLGW